MGIVTSLFVYFFFFGNCYTLFCFNCMNEGLKKFVIRNLVLLIAVINYIPPTLL